MALISGRMTCSSFYVTAFPIRPLLGVPSYFVGGGVIGSWKNIYSYNEKSVGSFVWEVANRKRRHSSEGVSGDLVASGNEATGVELAI